MRWIKLKPTEVQIDGPTVVADEHNNEFQFFKVDYVQTPMVCRPIDAWLLKPIFKEKEYAIPFSYFKPRFILDCGANIGTSAVFFANFYPGAKIVSVEPDLANFSLLKLNTSPYENITCIRAALWARETSIRLVGGYPASYKAHETSENDPDAIETTTVGKLLANSGFDEIDLLKIDIEGSEKEVFEADDVDEWLSKTKVIAIELHDRYKLGCSRALFRAILRHEFFCTQRGENLIFVREDLID